MLTDHARLRASSLSIFPAPSKKGRTREKEDASQSEILLSDLNQKLKKFFFQFIQWLSLFLNWRKTLKVVKSDLQNQKNPID